MKDAFLASATFLQRMLRIKMKGHSEQSWISNSPTSVPKSPTPHSTGILLTMTNFSTS